MLSVTLRSGREIESIKEEEKKKTEKVEGKETRKGNKLSSSLTGRKRGV